MPNQEIGRATVALYKKYIGRGPTSVNTVIAGDLVTSILTDALTRAEKSLVDAGDADSVRRIRRKFQEAMAPELREIVEGATGRKARTVLSDHDVVNDIAFETVLLEPEGGEPAQM